MNKQENQTSRNAGEDLNAAYESKHDFRKVTVTLPPEAYERLVRESARRKIAGEPNHLLSALIREALSEYLNSRPAKESPASKE